MTLLPVCQLMAQFKARCRRGGKDPTSSFPEWPQFHILPYPMRLKKTDYIIFSDLDGSLLDAATYSYDAADAALRKVFESPTQLVFVSSKTRAEMEPLRTRLRLPTPFIVENGGAVFIPDGYFPFSIEDSVSCGPYRVIEIGTPYAGLRAALKEIDRDLSCRLHGFGDMTMDEIARYTGLSPADARLAKQREFDEPFLVTGREITLQQLQARAEAKGLNCTKGGRFYHLMGSNDKGQATVRLIELYRRLAQLRGHEILTIGIGDSLNDLPMLQVVDRPVLVQKPDGAYDSDVDLPGLIRAPGIGPAGWNAAVLDLLPSG